MGGSTPEPLTFAEKTLLKGKLHTLGRSILTGNVAFVGANLCSAGLHDIDVVEKLQHIQDFDLSDNQVSDLKPLASSNVLKVLRLGKNKLKVCELSLFLLCRVVAIVTETREHFCWHFMNCILQNSMLWIFTDELYRKNMYARLIGFRCFW